MALIDISKFKNRTQVVKHVYQDESYFKPDITFADFLVSYLKTSSRGRKVCCSAS